MVGPASQLAVDSARSRSDPEAVLRIYPSCYMLFWCESTHPAHTHHVGCMLFLERQFQTNIVDVYLLFCSNRITITHPSVILHLPFTDNFQKVIFGHTLPGYAALLFLFKMKISSGESHYLIIRFNNKVNRLR